MEFAIGVEIAPLWRLLDGVAETGWTDAIDMTGAQVAVAEYCPEWWQPLLRHDRHNDSDNRNNYCDDRNDPSPVGIEVVGLHLAVLCERHRLDNAGGWTPPARISDENHGNKWQKGHDLKPN